MHCHSFQQANLIQPENSYQTITLNNCLHGLHPISPNSAPQKKKMLHLTSIIGLFIAGIPFYIYAKLHIPDRADFITNMQIFLSQQYARKRKCKVCRSLSCPRCKTMGKYITILSSSFQRVRYVRKGFYSLVETTTPWSDRFLFKGVCGYWQLIGMDCKKSRMIENGRLKKEIEGYLSEDKERLGLIAAMYGSLALFIIAKLWHVLVFFGMCCVGSVKAGKEAPIKIREMHSIFCSKNKSCLTSFRRNVIANVIDQQNLPYRNIAYDMTVIYIFDLTHCFISSMTEKRVA